MRLERAREDLSLQFATYTSIKSVRVFVSFLCTQFAISIKCNGQIYLVQNATNKYNTRAPRARERELRPETQISAVSQSRVYRMLTSLSRSGTCDLRAATWTKGL